MSSLCREGKLLLETGDISSFEKILHESWILKREVASGVSNNDIDEIYDIGMKSGARGGKLLGAGGSGFILFFCDEQAKRNIRKELSNLREIHFKFDETGSIRVL
jgi:D-glycero-alpha-D-manno-heptose-7-phosphate kinase